MVTFARVGGRALHYAHRAGTGRPVVFANSLGTDLRIWDGVIAHLPADTPTLCLDKRGHGLSELGPVSIAALAEDVAALMEQCAITNAVICGVSVGGMIAQALALARPDLVSGLVLVCTAAKIGDAATWNGRIEGVRQGGLAPLADGILERWFPETFRTAQPTELAGWRAMLTRTDAESYARVCEAIRDTDLTAELPKITAPALCLAGAEDLAVPDALNQDLARHLPRAQVITLDGIGHLPPIEAPGAVADAIQTLRTG